MAPEIIQGSSSYTLSADVYSYGIVLWEIASQEKPWTEVKETTFFMAALLKRILAGQRPHVNEAWPQTYSDLMVQCWATSPTARPLFGLIVDTLEHMFDDAFKMNEENIRKDVDGKRIIIGKGLTL